MQRRIIKGEVWLSVPGWPYEVGSLGHIRRRRGNRPVESRIDTDGYTSVVLTRGKQEMEVYLDSLIASVFGGRELNGKRPLHVDGLPWNNWAKNLDWGLNMSLGNKDNLVVTWTVWRGGRLQHGPFTDKAAVLAAWESLRVGDLIVGRNPKRAVVSVEIMFSRNRTVSPQNPLHMAKKYRALSDMHKEHFWSHELLEAAVVIEALTMDHINQIPDAGMAVSPPPVRDVARTRRVLPPEPAAGSRQRRPLP